MATNNNTFTAVTSGVRDLSDDKAAVYYLDGNSTNGRLNINQNSRVKFGDNTHVVIDGNSSHSHMNGTLEANALTYALIPTTGRADFGSSICSYDTTDITFLFLGDGNIFLHLEDDNNNSSFSGFTRIILDKSDGEAYVQFSSKEYQGVEIQERQNNNSTNRIYVARLSQGFTSLTGFKTLGLTSLEIFYGTKSTSSGRIYDPVYDGISNNLLPLRIAAFYSADKHMHEYFSIDVTSIRHDDVKIRLVDSENEVQHNDVSLTEANTTPLSNNGDDLEYYNGRSVVLFKAREIETTLSTTRRTASYIIRKVGYNDIIVNNATVNAPIVIEDMTINDAYSNTSEVSEVSNTNELVDGFIRALQNDLSVSSDLLTFDGTSIVIKSGYTLAVDNTISSSVEIDNTTIKVKLGNSSLSKTDKFDTLVGSVDDSFIGNTNAFFVKSNGKVTYTLTNINPNEFDYGGQQRLHVLYKKTTEATWSIVSSANGVETTFNIDVEPNTDYNIRIRAMHYTWVDKIVTIPAYGLSESAGLVPESRGGVLLYDFPFNAQEIDNISYENSTFTVEAENLSDDMLTISFGSAYHKMTDILHYPGLVQYWVNNIEVNSDGTGFILPKNNFINIYLTDDSLGHVIFDFTIKHDSVLFSTEESYIQNNVVVYNDEFYSFKEAKIAGAWDQSKVKQIAEDAIDRLHPNSSGKTIQVKSSNINVNNKIDVDKMRDLSYQFGVLVYKSGVSLTDASIEISKVSDGSQVYSGTLTEKIAASNIYSVDVELASDIYQVKIGDRYYMLKAQNKSNLPSSV